MGKAHGEARCRGCIFRSGARFDIHRALFLRRYRRSRIAPIDWQHRCGVGWTSPRHRHCDSDQRHHSLRRDSYRQERQHSRRCPAGLDDGRFQHRGGAAGRIGGGARSRPHHGERRRREAGDALDDCGAPARSASRSRQGLRRQRFGVPGRHAGAARRPPDGLEGICNRGARDRLAHR